MLRAVHCTQDLSACHFVQGGGIDPAPAGSASQTQPALADESSLPHTPPYHRPAAPAAAPTAAAAFTPAITATTAAAPDSLPAAALQVAAAMEASLALRAHGRVTEATAASAAAAGSAASAQPDLGRGLSGALHMVSDGTPTTWVKLTARADSNLQQVLFSCCEIALTRVAV